MDTEQRNPLTGELKGKPRWWEPVFNHMFEVTCPSLPILTEVIQSIEIENKKLILSVRPLVNPDEIIMVPSLSEIRRIDNLTLSQFNKRGNIFLKREFLVKLEPLKEKLDYDDPSATVWKLVFEIKGELHKPVS